MLVLLLGSAVLALAGRSTAQLTGRGFPNCDSGPLKNNTVCDKSAGISTTFYNITQSLDTDGVPDPLTRATALIKLFTIEEKLNNTGHVSPGVPRLGLPAYTVSQPLAMLANLTNCHMLTKPNIEVVARGTSWRSRITRCQFLGFWAVLSCNIVSSAHSDGRCLRRSTHHRCGDSDLD